MLPRLRFDTSPRLRIGLIGWGTVGCALGRLLQDGPEPLELAAIAVRDRRNPRNPLPPGVPVGSPDEVIGEASVVVELAGGVEQPLSWGRSALSQRKAFVTANKALLANHGGELARLAHERQTALLGSGSVGGAVPMIELVHHLSATGAVERIRGLLNATSTYLLTRMSEGLPLEEALAEAQRVGYAEADPTLDLNGRDAAQKLAILASVAWGGWRSERDVSITAIEGVTPERGAVIRLVAEATAGEMMVRPIRLEPDSPFASASGVESALEVTVGEAGLFRVSGPGAGGRATAGAVYADLVRLAGGELPILFGGNE
jgi:homoserine dehydrogenase